MPDGVLAHMLVAMLAPVPGTPPADAVPQPDPASFRLKDIILVLSDTKTSIFYILQFMLRNIVADKNMLKHIYNYNLFV